MKSYIDWVGLITVLAVAPWAWVVILREMHRITLAQIGLQVTLLTIALAAPGHGLPPFLVAVLMLVGSALVAGKSVKSK